MNTTLVLFKRNGKRKDIPISEKDIIIGRQPDCNIRVLKSSVSRRHCKVTLVDNKVTVSDLKSSNGTFVNNKKIKAPTRVHPGDILTVADIHFTLTIDGKPQELSPPEMVLNLEQLYYTRQEWTNPENLSATTFS